jgi:hypothetical protein
MRQNAPSFRNRWLVVALFAALTIAGCKRTNPNSSGERDLTGISEVDSPSSNSVNQSPPDVAQAVIEAVAAKDRKAFLSMMAHETIESDMQSITGGRTEFRRFTQDAAEKASALIFNSLLELDAGTLKVINETTLDQRSTCTFAGTKNGQTVERILYLVNEKGAWKIVPSHR